MTPAGPTGQQFAISCGATSATIVEVGGGLRSLAVAGRQVLDGYDADAMADSGRGQVLIPWPNRLDHGRYDWDGQGQQAPINEIERSNAIHGLVRFATWNCVEASADRIDMAHTLWPSPGYPFTLQIQIRYRVEEDGLTVTTTTRNVGTARAPYGAGQHPYLVPPGGVSVDQCELLVPAMQYLETDDRGLPTAAHPLVGTELDFTKRRPIGPLELDTAFTDLTRDLDGRVRVELGGGGQSIQLWADDSYNYIQVFTGDTLPESRRRRSIAVEPMTCPPNAFATGIDVVRLEPDETATSSWGIVGPDHDSSL